MSARSEADDGAGRSGARDAAIPHLIGARLVELDAARRRGGSREQRGEGEEEMHGGEESTEAGR
jgi:hypothetical protein